MTALTHYTDRLILRPPLERDLNSLFQIYSDPETNVYNPFGPISNVNKAEELLYRWISHWKQYTFGNWAISAIHNPETIIGFGGLSFKQYGPNEKLNLGYRFAVNAWGKGYATELCFTALNYAFNELKFSEVFAIVRPNNNPSIRVLEKVQMVEHDKLDDIPGQPESIVYVINK